MEHLKTKSVIPIYLIGLVWLFYSILFPLYRIQDLVIAAILSFTAFLAATFIISKTDKRKGISYIETGDKNMDEMLESAAKDLDELKALSKSLSNTKLDNPIKELENVTVKILGLVRNEPNKASQASQFLEYYLPTTVKIFKSYKEFESGGQTGGNLTTGRMEIEEFMAKLVDAFHNILDSLYCDKVTDISIDMEVMETMLKQDRQL